MFAIAVIVVFMTMWIGTFVIYFSRPVQLYQGLDYTLYMNATARWLGGGPFYEPYQLAGPYVIEHGAILYPPIALPLFVLFQYLPAFLWWAIPIGGTVAMVIYHRPSLVACAGIAMCLWFPANAPKLLNGNPLMWAVLAVALGTRWSAVAPWALIKVSLFPFAAVHINRRPWWLSMLVIVLITLAMWPLTMAWLTAVRNGMGSGGLLYSAQEVPLMFLPILAWLGSTRRRQVRGSPLPSAGDAGAGAPADTPSAPADTSS